MADITINKFCGYEDPQNNQNYFIGLDIQLNNYVVQGQLRYIGFQNNNADCWELDVVTSQGNQQNVLLSSNPRPRPAGMTRFEIDIIPQPSVPGSNVRQEKPYTPAKPCG